MNFDAHQMEAIRQMMDKEFGLKVPCFICAKPTLDRGIFFPDDSQAWGAKPGQRRAIFYACCVSHIDDDEHTAVEFSEKIEAELARRMKEPLGN
jgi:hypothetical protein